VSKSIKIILICFIVIICVFALYGLAFRPLLARVRITTDEIKMKETQLQLIKMKVAAISDLETTLEKARASDQVAIPNIPEQLTLSEIYAGIDSLSRASGLKVKQITTDQTFQIFAKNHHLKYIAVTIEGNAYFPQVISFLEALSKSPFIIQVENMDLSSISRGSKPWLQFKLTLNAFEYASK
jgi:Tfp pilus assembly protein PilO